MSIGVYWLPDREWKTTAVPQYNGQARIAQATIITFWSIAIEQLPI
jgi:hypothetical protein